MIYPSIRIEGAILSPDILEKLEDIAGQRPVDFGLEPSVKVKEEIARAWADAQDYWRLFNRKLETLKKESPATTETRNLWVVPLLGLLGYQLEFEAKSIELNAKLYPISHRITNRGGAAIHITGSNEPAGLDRKPEKAALRMSAHAMLQEYLNLTEQLYGIVTNGRVLRLLRDSSRLVKLTYLEFDLDRIFTDGLFADFAVLYRLLHVTRLPQTIETSATSLLEGYHQETIEQGSRIRDGLRLAVKEALKTLGTGFLEHPENHELRQQVASGELRPDVYFNQLLRLIYRLLFLMVIEERGMVFPKGTATKKSTIYVQHYSIERLRRQARNRSLQVTCYSDGWLQLLSTFHLFEDRDGAAALGTTLLGGQLFSPANLGLLPHCTLSNKALYSTLEQLCFFTLPENGQRMPVNFGGLATEEFGSVYESLLELHPFTDLLPTPLFDFRHAAGNERKTTGSYYTHAALVESLLQSALDPHIDEAEKSTTPEKSILALKVCDPACGSGHFLIAAAQRIARRLARLRAGDEEPSPELLHHTLREVIGHCIFGVDINPMAAELCRVGLWLEAMEPGKPLSFLEHHIRVGNSLMGTTPELIAAGLPHEAFKPIEGDNKEACAILKKWNRGSREGLGPLFAQHDEQQQQHLQAAALAIEEMPDDDLRSVLEKKSARLHLENEEEYRIKKLVADAWCAAFVIEKSFSEPGIEQTAFGVTQSLLLHIIDQNLTREHQKIVDEVEKLAESYQFFHWHLAFPEVYAQGGFDCIIGNPPWERVKLQEKEWFAERCETIAMASNASARKKLIRELNATNPTLQEEFLASLRKTVLRRF
ncbi:MAG: N-6 DNA methylase [Chlorobium sp.]|nr:N-6 DNA methylase [Chlorobium sp.]